MINTLNFLNSVADSGLPRILTQICRDSGSAGYGSCDRNWWHYKIRDFSSIILQQAGYTLAVAAETNDFSSQAKGLQELAAATCLFWNKRAKLYGAFEEYYPFEQGYPPLAFSTLAVAKLCASGLVSLTKVTDGFAVATKQMLTRFESQAANQQVAGLAALAVIKSIAPALVSQKEFDTLLDRTLSLQTPEGWFPEYDGPDLGYLSVTLDCLWDIYDVTGDNRCLRAIEKAFDFIAWFVLSPFAGAGMHNARNTDYIVPYGIARLGVGENPHAYKALQVLVRLYGQNGTGRKVIDAIDDRYWCHYVGHSFFRALAVLESCQLPEVSVEAFLPIASSSFQSGHYMLSGADKISPDALISARKGAIVTAVWPGGRRFSDFGWILESRKTEYVSHWWSPHWEVGSTGGKVFCEGFLPSHREHISKPWKHVVLRVASFLCGKRIIGLLKKLAIFKKMDSTFFFRREVSLESDCVIVTDCFRGKIDNATFSRAQRFSKRHVASADCYHYEDFQDSKGIYAYEDRRVVGGELTITTRYCATAKK